MLLVCVSFLPGIHYHCARWVVSAQQGGAGISDRERQTKKAKFDGGYASTMQGAEAFFNKPSPFQKAAQEKGAAEAAATASTDGSSSSSSVDARILDAVDSAEIAAETTGTVIEVGGAALCIGACNILSTVSLYLTMLSVTGNPVFEVPQVTLKSSQPVQQQ